MITGLQKDALSEELDSLRLYDCELILTGSRFFGFASEESDWDFFTSEENREFLLSIGYEEASKGHYKDDLLVCLLKHKKLPIHIQLVRDVEVKRLAQEMLATDNGQCIMCSLRNNKTNKRELWNLIIRTILMSRSL